MWWLEKAREGQIPGNGFSSVSQLCLFPSIREPRGSGPDRRAWESTRRCGAGQNAQQTGAWLCPAGPRPRAAPPGHVPQTRSQTKPGWVVAPERLKWTKNRQEPGVSNMPRILSREWLFKMPSLRSVTAIFNLCPIPPVSRGRAMATSTRTKEYMWLLGQRKRESLREAHWRPRKWP